GAATSASPSRTGGSAGGAASFGAGGGSRVVAPPRRWVTNQAVTPSTTTMARTMRRISMASRRLEARPGCSPTRARRVGSSPMRRLVALALVAAAAVGTAGCGDGGPSADPALFCERLDRLAENDPFAVLGASATEAEMEAAFGALRERATELAEVAPEDVRA